MATKGFIGIDAGTQGLSVIFTDDSLKVLATGEGDYAMVPSPVSYTHLTLPTILLV